MAVGTQNVHIDKALTNISVGYKNEQFISEQLFLPVTVNKQSDKYYVYDKSMFRYNDDLRAPGSESREISWKFSTDSYFCDGHAIKTFIPDEEIANADDVFQLETDATELVTENIMIGKEINLASMVTNTANYAAGHFGTPATLWSAAGSKPINDVQDAKEVIHQASGIRANTLVISEPTLNALIVNSQILGIFKTTERGVANMEDLKAALKVDYILVGSGLKSSATNPGQTDTLSYIWGNNAILCYIPNRPGRKTPAFGYTFLWNKDGMGATTVRKWYDDAKQAQLIEANKYYSHKIVCNTAAYLFANVVA